MLPNIHVRTFGQKIQPSCLHNQECILTLCKRPLPRCDSNSLFKTMIFQIYRHGTLFLYIQRLSSIIHGSVNYKDNNMISLIHNICHALSTINFKRKIIIYGYFTFFSNWNRLNYIFLRLCNNLNICSYWFNQTRQVIALWRLKKTVLR